MHPHHSARTPVPDSLRRHFVAVLSAAALLLSPAATFAAGGTLDTTFGAGGITLTNTTGSTPSTNDLDNAVALAVQPDGKVVAFGHKALGYGISPDLKLVRYNEDGSLDETFGTGGIATVAYSSATEHPSDVALQADGKIVAVGSTSSTSPIVALAVRLDPDGSLDTTFGNGGYVTITYAAGVSSSASAVLVQSDGKLVIAGDSGGKFGVARLLPADGALDTTFGTGGKAVVTPSSRIVVRPTDAALQTISGEQRIVLASQYQQGNNGDFGLMRLRASGARDTSFGSSGSVQTDIAGGSDQANDIAVDGSNRIVAAGSAGPAKGAKTGMDFAVVRYTANGALDATFGAGGKQRTDFARLNDSAQSVAIQSDGKIAVCGYIGSGSSNDLGIARYDAGGALDPMFGSGGLVQLDLFGRSESIHAIVTQTVTNPDATTRERLLVGGASDTGAGYDTLLAAFEE
jgi:uncharacterized delta-60 repeat protein